ncbi:MAG TPA: hypothetical protein PLE36_02110 [Deltaproteobacteria bacterium]|jgi:hypothetical protein|nr:hypothetical protein [Deltaproteobacteria bacterium]HRT44077.1 hypothetical protein [Desulfomonilia bacterium]HOE71585.1 hypothetical protein [Deltaproteobacteria bacterium]HON62997.1 hypothetical protein [Deltaproteobacteria bacterium]HOS26668.1 hypothetical protein [Deltaproteobacteria bacterium]
MLKFIEIAGKSTSYAFSGRCRPFIALTEGWKERMNTSQNALIWGPMGEIRTVGGLQGRREMNGATG